MWKSIFAISLDDFIKQIKDLNVNPKFIALYHTIEHDSQKIIEEINKNFETEIFGCTSFQGIFTPKGFTRGIGGLLSDEAYIEIKTAYSTFETKTPYEAGKQMATKVKTELKTEPDLIIMHATPGFEEEIIKGIEEILPEVDIIGGSAGDDDLSGKWVVLHKNGAIKNGVVIAGIKSKREIRTAFISGYFPTGKKGKVTKAKKRIIYEINGKPAAEVYNEWTFGSIENELKSGGIVLPKTTLKPLAKIVGKIGAMNVYSLSHPEKVILPEKALSTFTEWETGEEVILMNGTEKGLLKRTSMVVAQSLLGIKGKIDIKAGILIYCAGCVNVVIKNADEIVKNYFEELGKEIPLIGPATFGEQGRFFIEGKKVNKHANLMCNTILFE